MTRSFIWILLGVFCISLILLMATTAWAQDEDEELIDDGKSLWDIIKTGGNIGWLIIGCGSLVILFALLDFILSFRKGKLCPTYAVQELKRLIKHQKYSEVQEYCEFYNNNALCRVTGAILARADFGIENMEKALETATDKEAIILSKKTNKFLFLGIIGLLLGVVGSITGLIGAFMVIEQMSSPSPAQLARGVYGALVTSAMGIYVAIITTIIYFYFKNRVISYIVKIDTVCRGYLDTIIANTSS